jgi:hypothetical protein
MEKLAGEGVGQEGEHLVRRFACFQATAGLGQDLVPEGLRAAPEVLDQVDRVQGTQPGEELVAWRSMISRAAAAAAWRERIPSSTTSLRSSTVYR